jgi:hypothetical protein
LFATDHGAANAISSFLLSGTSDLFHDFRIPRLDLAATRNHKLVFIKIVEYVLQFARDIACCSVLERNSGAGVKI